MNTMNVLNFLVLASGWLFGAILLGLWIMRRNTALRLLSSRQELLDAMGESLRAMTLRSEERSTELEKMRQARNSAYTERNRVVAALARCFPSGIRATEIEGWCASWQGCVYIDLPAGQISFHYHTSEALLFEHLPAYTKPWDNHTKQDVFKRLATLV